MGVTVRDFNPATDVSVVVDIIEQHAGRGTYAALGFSPRKAAVNIVSGFAQGLLRVRVAQSGVNHGVPSLPFVVGVYISQLSAPMLVVHPVAREEIVALVPGAPAGAADALLDDLEAWARDAGARMLLFGSLRNFERSEVVSRWLKKRGYEVVETTWAMDFPSGEQPPPPPPGPAGFS